MKTKITFSLLGLFFASTVSTAFGADLTFSDRDSNPDRAAAPNKIITLLRNSEIPFRALNEGIYSVSVKNILCESSHNGALGEENPEAGVARNSCRADSTNEKFSKKGKRLAESAALLEIVNLFELSDCAMGYCGNFISSLNCTVDTKVESFTGAGRFACTIQTKE